MLGPPKPRRLDEPIAVGTEVELRPGDAVYLPAGTRHQLRNDGAERVVLLVAFAVEASACGPCPAAPPAP